MIKSSDQDTRACLLGAATSVFSELGFKGTTTREIARRAGVNLALLSYHWGGKEQLWAEVVKRLHQRLIAAAQMAVANIGLNTCKARTLTAERQALARQVAEFLRAAIHQILSDPAPLRVMAWASLQPDGFDPTLVATSYGPAVQAAVAFLQDQQRLGRIPAHVDVPMAIVTFYGLVAEPVIEANVHRTLFGFDISDPAHAVRVERHLVASGLRLLSLEQI